MFWSHKKAINASYKLATRRYETRGTNRRILGRQKRIINDTSKNVVRQYDRTEFISDLLTQKQSCCLKKATQKTSKTIAQYPFQRQSKSASHRFWASDYSSNSNRNKTSKRHALNQASQQVTNPCVSLTDRKDWRVQLDSTYALCRLRKSLRFRLHRPMEIYEACEGNTPFSSLHS
uniref:Transposase n=1 Tax=Toxocara canis TaxID=6265 RepID=A0A183UG19_TOXCA